MAWSDSLSQNGYGPKCLRRGPTRDDECPARGWRSRWQPPEKRAVPRASAVAWLAWRSRTGCGDPIASCGGALCSCNSARCGDSVVPRVCNGLTVCENSNLEFCSEGSKTSASGKRSPGGEPGSSRRAARSELAERTPEQGARNSPKSSPSGEPGPRQQKPQNGKRSQLRNDSKTAERETKAKWRAGRSPTGELGARRDNEHNGELDAGRAASSELDETIPKRRI